MAVETLPRLSRGLQRPGQRLRVSCWGLALGRSNEGVCDGQRQPVPHRLSVRVARRAMQHRGAPNSVRIARAGGTDAASSHDRWWHSSDATRRGRHGCESSYADCASWAVACRYVRRDVRYAVNP